jgi:hypothetical protein
MKYQYPVIGIIGIIIVMAIFFFSQQMILSNSTITERVNPKITNYDNSIEVSTNKIQITDGVKHSIPLDKIKSGGPPKDGIPSIDNPKFTNIQNANFMSNSDTVIGLEINGTAKAYPLFILVWHG